MGFSGPYRRLGPFAAGLVLAGLLSACGVREVRPSDNEMDRVDAALQAEPCVGELVDWHRNYYYHAKYFGDEVEKAAKEGRAPRASGHVRYIVGFDLRSRRGGDSAQRVSLVHPPISSDDAPVESGAERRAAGTFNLRSGELSMARCDADTAEDAG